MADNHRARTMGANTMNSMFSESENIIITDGTFTQNNGMLSNKPSEGFTELRHAVSPAAFHNSGERLDPPKCHPNTRVAILDRMINWIMCSEDRNALIMWLFGSAGTGKSAIAQTVAERLHTSKLLLASFFFSRSDPTRNHPRTLIATLAYQICLNIPEARDAIAGAVEHDPFVFTRSIEAQLMALVVQPLQTLSQSQSSMDLSTSPRVIIVDGLDECHDRNTQSTILTAISSILHNNNVPLLFLIASRPETQISAAFNSIQLRDLHNRISLDDIYQASLDIRFFFDSKFDEIKATHPRKGYLDPTWPRPEVIGGLVLKASGQFIYASVVIKFVSSIRHRPNERLDIILGLRPGANVDAPFSELDALYYHIFSSLTNAPAALLILGFLHFGNVPLGEIAFIEEFLDMNPGDVEMIMDDMMSVVHIETFPIVPVPMPTITIPHASLMDFLTDQDRAREFFVAPKVIHTALAQQCFINIKRLAAHPSNKYILNHAYSPLLSHLTQSDHRQLREYILEFSPGEVFLKWDLSRIRHFLPAYLDCVRQLELPDAENIYNQQLGKLKAYWASKLPLYYADPHLTFLLETCRLNFDQKQLEANFDIVTSIGLFEMRIEKRKIDDTGFLFLPLYVLQHEDRGYRDLVKRCLDDLIPGQILPRTPYAWSAQVCLKHICRRIRSDIVKKFADQGWEMRRHSPWRWRTRAIVKRRQKRAIKRRCRCNPVSANESYGSQIIMYPRFHTQYLQPGNPFAVKNGIYRLALGILSGLITKVSAYSEPFDKFARGRRLAFASLSSVLVRELQQALEEYRERMPDNASYI